MSGFGGDVGVNSEIWERREGKEKRGE